MAIMIPDRLPREATRGEGRAFDLLQKLPDDCVCYYEPVIGERYPDFVVIMPGAGVLIVEVKDWFPSNIVRADTQTVTINRQGKIETRTNPIRQARDYKHDLMDACRNSPRVRPLLKKDGPYEGRFIFPFGHVVFMSNIQRDQIKRMDAALADHVFPESRIVTRDEMDALLALPPGELLDAMRGWFNPSWPFPRMTVAQVDLIRSIIHPEIVISGRSVAVLDHKQEARARSIGQGHRLIYGVAGSGKTVILMARAKMLAAAGKRVLLLCFNRELARYFRESMRGYSNVEAMNFHSWAKRNQAFAGENPDWNEEAIGNALLDQLKPGQGDANRFDAVLIDEGQDFHPRWFSCAKQALKHPDNGDLLIALDGGQSLYARPAFTWKSVGVNATGRVVSRRAYDLDRNYRNTRQILTAAAPFAAVNKSDDDDDALQSFLVDPTFAAREGPAPKSFAADGRAAEIRAVVNTVEAWLKDGIGAEGDPREPLGPDNIAVLYPRSKGFEPHLESLLGKLRQLTGVRSVSSETRREDSSQPMLTVSTIHSAKGLQFKAVIVIWADLFNPQNYNNDRALLYVGMTRAQTFLCISWARGTTLTTEIEAAIASLDRDEPPSLQNAVIDATEVSGETESRRAGILARLFSRRRPT